MLEQGIKAARSESSLLSLNASSLSFNSAEGHFTLGVRFTPGISASSTHLYRFQSVDTSIKPQPVVKSCIKVSSIKTKSAPSVYVENQTGITSKIFGILANKNKNSSQVDETKAGTSENSIQQKNLPRVVPFPGPLRRPPIRMISSELVKNLFENIIIRN